MSVKCIIHIIVIRPCQQFVVIHVDIGNISTCTKFHLHLYRLYCQKQTCQNSGNFDSKKSQLQPNLTWFLYFSYSVVVSPVISDPTCHHKKTKWLTLGIRLYLLCSCAAIFILATYYRVGRNSAMCICTLHIAGYLCNSNALSVRACNAWIMLLWLVFKAFVVVWPCRRAVYLLETSLVLVHSDSHHLSKCTSSCYFC